MSAFQIVNGYVCFNCSQVALAQKGINPADPPAVPGGPQTTSDGSPSSGGGAAQNAPAVVFGGSLSQLQGAATVQPADASSAVQPASQTPAGQLNILA